MDESLPVKQWMSGMYRKQVIIINDMVKEYEELRSAEKVTKAKADELLSYFIANRTFQNEERKRLRQKKNSNIDALLIKHRRVEIQTAVLSYLNFILNCLYLHTQLQIPVSYIQRPIVKYDEVDDAALFDASSKFEEKNTRVATSSSFDNNFSPVNFISFCLQLYINLIYLYVSITSSSYPRAHPKEISCRSRKRRRCFYYRTRKMCNLILDFNTQTFLLKLSSSSLVIFNIFITSHCFYDNNYNYLFDNMHYSSLPSFFYAS